MKDLKQKTIRGGSARAAALVAGFVIRVASVAILARLLEPRDFGLLGMVTAFTGVLTLFRDFGLSTAAIQQTTVTEEQSSALFWINVLAGGILAALAAASAPFLGMLYHEPRLTGITLVVAISFLFNAAGVQHSARLQRQMRFTALAGIDVAAGLLSNAIGIAAAILGSGLWALVAIAVLQPLANTVGLWLAEAWIPRMPRRAAGIRSMLRFGGTLTANGLIMYIASNCEKILLGRAWGAQALGLYGRAYQLIRIPTDNLNSAVGDVAFSALSRIQDDPARLRSYFLKGYSLVLSLTLPITIACAIFAEDIILILLGPKWTQAAEIFRLLAPTMLIFAIANPLGWLLNSMGLVKRGLHIALVIAPLMLASYIIGLPYGPRGVALAYSVGALLWIVPVAAWCIKGTMISGPDMLLCVGRPLASIALPAALALALKIALARLLPPFSRLCLETAVLFAAYFAILLFIAGQKELYLDLFRGFRNRSAGARADLVSSLEPESSQ
jgi:PST family polysaccharide transporter